jgi:DUF1680 family protein
MVLQALLAVAVQVPRGALAQEAQLPQQGKVEPVVQVPQAVLAAVAVELPQLAATVELVLQVSGELVRRLLSLARP